MQCTQWGQTQLRCKGQTFYILKIPDVIVITITPQAPFDLAIVSSFPSQSECEGAQNAFLIGICKGATNHAISRRA